MANGAVNGSGRHWNAWRIALWGAAALILLLPLLAMQFTNEVNWDETDFIFAGVLIGGVGLAFEGAVRMTRNYAYRAAVAIALAAAFLTTWINLAVGIIGNEDNPANLMFFGVIALGIAAAFVARFRPHGMALAMLSTATAQAAVAVVALAMGHFTFVLAGFFAALWLLSAWLFRKAARDHAGADSAMQSRMNDAP